MILPESPELFAFPDCCCCCCTVAGIDGVSSEADDMERVNRFVELDDKDDGGD